MLCSRTNLFRLLNRVFDTTQKYFRFSLEDHLPQVWHADMFDPKNLRVDEQVAVDGANHAASLPAYLAVADYLMRHDAATSLTGAEWMIEDIAGHSVVDDIHASLQFLPDGRQAGSGSCNHNRLLGSCPLNDDAFSIKPAGITMMACPEALMRQERRPLQMLPKINGFKIDGGGSLVLQTMDGKSIIVRQQEVHHEQ